MFGVSEAGAYGTIEYRLLTEDKIESALELQQRTMLHENVARGVGLYEEKRAAEAMKIVFEEVIKDNCTIIAVDVKRDHVAGVSFNKICEQPTDKKIDSLAEVVNNYVKPRSCLALIEFLDKVESKADVFKTYNIQTAMEIFYVGTDSGYRGHGIAQRLVAESLKLAKNMDIIHKNTQKYPEVVFGVFTSNYSQKIAENLGFCTLEIVKYADHEYWGKTMAERIGDEHKTAKLAAKILRRY